jgi:two-component system chemotaxis response regulator CheY
MKIMIVDDSTMVRMVIERYLKLTDLKVVGQAANGIEAIKLFKEQMPDIVTLDITMPEMDGIVALAEMLKINPEVRVIMISGLSGRATVVKAVNAGAVAYLTKPVTAHQLVDTLKRVIEMEK